MIQVSLVVDAGPGTRQVHEIWVPTVPRVGEQIEFANTSENYEVTAVVYFTNEWNVSKVMVKAR